MPPAIDLLPLQTQPLVSAKCSLVSSACTGVLDRFFVAAPMVASNHHRIGSVCLMEKAPQRAGIPMLQMLANLAELTVRLLEESLPRPVIAKALTLKT